MEGLPNKKYEELGISTKDSELRSNCSRLLSIKKNELGRRYLE